MTIESPIVRNTITEQPSNKNRITEFTYGLATTADLNVHKVERSDKGKITLKEIEIDGIPVHATRRFWRSFFTRFGIAENVFRYFSPEEVFSRIHERNRDDSFRFCIAQTRDASPTPDANSARGSKPRIRRELLAVTNPNRPVIRYDETLDLLKRHGGADLKYQNGVITSTHQPRGGSRSFAIGGDQFHDQFCLETPVDGYGHPRLFLSMLRLVCSNGMIGYSRAFRSDVPVGKDMQHCITRAIASFDNGDGYAALRQRFESAQTSWASVHECLQFGAVIEKLSRQRQLTQPNVLGRFRGVAG